MILLDVPLNPFDEASVRAFIDSLRAHGEAVPGHADLMRMALNMAAAHEARRATESAQERGVIPDAS